MGYMGYRSRGGAFEVKVIRVQMCMAMDEHSMIATAALV